MDPGTGVDAEDRILFIYPESNPSFSVAQSLVY
jgi:hypothetical protein